MPARGAPRWAYDRTYWTRERVVRGLLRFHRERGLAPTSTKEWHALTRFHSARRPSERRYPSGYAVTRHFRTLVDAWRACGLAVDPKQWRDWTPEEDAFLAEATGLLSRAELAECLERTPVAVHARCSLLGVNAWSAHGWSAHKLERATGVSAHAFRRAIAEGALASHTGTRVIYVDLADVPAAVPEAWAGAPPELVRAAERAARRRLLHVLDARAAGRHPLAGWLYRRAAPPPRRPRRDRTGPLEGGAPPLALEAGDWVRVCGSVPQAPAVEGRVGWVMRVYRPRLSSGPYARGTWLAQVDFPRERAGPGPERPRTHRAVPLEALRWLGPTHRHPTGRGPRR